VLIKRHAEVVVDDEVVLPEFQKHCRVILILYEDKFENSSKVTLFTNTS